MSKGAIPQEARTELEKGDIPIAVKLTAARNPDCSRLEICALLGEAIMDNPPAAIPLAAPLRWDQDWLQSQGLSEASTIVPEALNDNDPELDRWFEKEQDTSSFKNAFDRIFPNTDDRRRLREVEANKSHDTIKLTPRKSLAENSMTGGCCLFGLIGMVLMFFYAGWGLIMIGAGLMFLVYSHLVTTRKEEEEQELTKSAEPIGLAQVEAGGWGIVRGKINCASPIHSVVSEEPLAYVHVMITKQARIVMSGEEPSLGWGRRHFHVRRELSEAWLEADGQRINFTGSDYESLAFLEGDIPSNNDYKEIALSTSRKGRSESGVKAKRTKKHSAKAFLLDDGLHVATGKGKKKKITATAHCFAIDDEIWASGYVWDNGQGGKTMGAHLYRDGQHDSNILFLTDGDWRKKVRSSQKEFEGALSKLYWSLGVSAFFLLSGAIIIALNRQVEVTNWLRYLIEMLEEAE